MGSTSELDIDVRLVAATNRDLEEMVQKREFREDLYYRLNTVEIDLPPLRERREDIPLLAAHFLHTYAKENGREQLRFSPDAMRTLVTIREPGADPFPLVIEGGRFSDPDDLSNSHAHFFCPTRIRGSEDR